MSKTTTTAIATPAANNSVFDKIKKIHDARRVEQKDFSLKDLFKLEKSDVVKIRVIGFSSKFVPKYAKETCFGYHTMVYLADGRKTGGFSNALYRFADFYYQLTGAKPDGDFVKLMFPEGCYLDVEISQVEFDNSQKNTYEFNLIDGNLGDGHVELLSDGAGSGVTLITDDDPDTIPGEVIHE
jgi:hypothetical protein